MKRSRAGLALVLLLPLVAVPLTGCTEACDPGPPVTARGIATGPSIGGNGDFGMTLRVTDGPGGEPLQGAALVVYWADTRATSWSGSRVEVSASPSGSYVVVDPGDVRDTVPAETTLRLVTSADGTARANVPPNRIVGVVAAKDGFTQEWVPAMATGDTGSAGSVTVPLFRERVTLELDAVWATPAAGSPGTVTQGNYAWNPQIVPFGASDDANRGYAARIVEMAVTINWTNGPMSYGDLAVGVGHEEEGTAFFQDNGDNVPPGDHSELAMLDVGILQEHGILGAPMIRAGAASDSAFVAPFGMPYTMRIDARFDREIAERATSCGTVRGQSSDDESLVPGFEPLLALGVLVAVAALASRRKRA